MGSPSRKRIKRSTPSPAPPLRRSARLAGGQPSSLFSPEHLPASSGEQGIPESPVRSPTAEVQVPLYEMELAITPPRRIAAGVRLDAPLVVTFSTSKEKKRALEAGEMTDLSGIWAFVSLMKDDRSESLAPPRKDLLRGRTTDSIHPIDQEESGDEQPFAYATFPGLTITEPGRYCFKVNIIDMNNPFLEEAGRSNAKVLPALHSDVFDVVQSEGHSGQDENVGETINHLRAMGANV